FEDEHGLGQIEFARNRLHTLGVEVVGVEHNRQWVALKARVGKNVEDVIGKAHGSGSRVVCAHLAGFRRQRPSILAGLCWRAPPGGRPSRLFSQYFNAFTSFCSRRTAQIMPPLAALMGPLTGMRRTTGGPLDSR